MKKIWAKIIINHKVERSIVHDCAERIDVLNFWENVKEICEQLKVPTPVLLDRHAEQFLEFNTLKLKEGDFLEEIPFDWLLLESGD